MDYQKKELSGNVLKRGLVFLLAGIVLSGASFIFNPERALFNYLIMFMWIASVALGAFAFVGLEYLAGAVWSTPFRRVAEFLAAPIPLLLILITPVILGAHTLYHWTHTDVVAADPILKSKASYLNFNFFLIRLAVIILLWTLFYYLMTRNSKLQDADGNVSYTRRNIKLSVALAPVFVISITFFAIDLMMSLEPHWYSTMYGVYYLAGTLVAGLASFAVVSVLFLENKLLDSRVSSRHLHSLGVLLFGFNVFWAYIAFSQYLLIWYADIPEETVWFLTRMQGGWEFISIALLFIHFIIPFLVLIPSNSKTNLKTLKIMGGWLLFAHYFDLYWLIMPSYGKAGLVLGWQELGFPLLALGIVILVFRWKTRKNNLMPVADPKLESGINLSLYPDLSID